MFELHPRLAADTVEVTRLALARVLLMNDARFPWLILVPEREGAREWHRLAPADRSRLHEEAMQASAVLETVCAPDKLNLGALGNLVPQLHVHVVARRAGDAAWPGPVWGAGPAQPYAADARDALLARLRQAFAEATSEMS